VVVVQCRIRLQVRWELEVVETIYRP